MTDKQLQTKLNKLRSLCDDLDDEAKRRYGAGGDLFFESAGNMHITVGDSDAPLLEGIRFSSIGYARLGACDPSNGKRFKVRKSLSIHQTNNAEEKLLQTQQEGLLDWVLRKKQEQIDKLVQTENEGLLQWVLRQKQENGKAQKT